MDRDVTVKSRGRFGISNYRDKSRWFEKFPSQVGNKPVCVPVSSRNGESGDVRDKTREVGDVADKSSGMSRVFRGFLFDLSRTSRGNRHNGIWASAAVLNTD